jgi:hypothetical protein
MTGKDLKAEFFRIFTGTISEHESNFAAGDWNSKKEGGGTPSGGKFLVPAVWEYYQQRQPDLTLERTREKWATYSQEVKDNLRNHSAIKAIVKRLREEAAAAKKPVADAVIPDTL